ncbi:MAG TPA: hypothetical protein VLE72_00990 [Candidatus Saccharimonadales bacterium]|nr:hypothetical protein [Candidatus Saccharimonadales bacterium]
MEMLMPKGGVHVTSPAANTRLELEVIWFDHSWQINHKRAGRWQRLAIIPKLSLEALDTEPLPEPKHRLINLRLDEALELRIIHARRPGNPETDFDRLRITATPTGWNFVRYFRDQEYPWLYLPIPAEDRLPDNETRICHVCGDHMQRAGSCWACPTCGATSGCT